jgi:hypothetical protein
MRRVILFLAIYTIFSAGCARAASVTLTWTNPAFNAVAPGSCVSSPDTLRDLGRVELWGQRAGQPDSSLVLSRTEAGREGRVDSLITSQAEGTVIYWAYFFDLIGNRACRSNTASKTVTQPPVAGTLQ